MATETNGTSEQQEAAPLKLEWAESRQFILALHLDADLGRALAAVERTVATPVPPDFEDLPPERRGFPYQRHELPPDRVTHALAGLYCWMPGTRFLDVIASIADFVDRLPPTEYLRSVLVVDYAAAGTSAIKRLKAANPPTSIVPVIVFEGQGASPTPRTPPPRRPAGKAAGVASVLPRGGVVECGREAEGAGVRGVGVAPVLRRERRDPPGGVKADAGV
jgi:hypothetical protein